MSKILNFPKFAGPSLPPSAPDAAELLLRMLDEERRRMRKRWRAEKRVRVPVARRVVVSVSAPPMRDASARTLWGLGCALLQHAEAMHHTAVRLEGKSDKVLRAYIRAVRGLLRQAEQVEKSRAIRER